MLIVMQTRLPKEPTMTMHQNSQFSHGPATRFMGLGFLDNAVQQLLYRRKEWQARRNVVRTFAHMSNFHLQDIGLCKLDVEATCSASFDQPAFEALKRITQARIGNC
jgi:uncharacterized protein YjiS (DUF1127 family)